MKPRPAFLEGTGAALALLPLLPFPSPLRAVLALLAVLLAWPIAAAPFWLPRLPGRPGNDVPFGAAVAAGILLSMIPGLLLTVLGLAGVPLHVLGVPAVLLPVGTAALSFVVRRRTPRELPRVAGTSSFVRAAALPVLIVLLLGAIHGSPLGITDDAFDHLAGLRYMLDRDRVDFPGAFYAVDPPAGQDPRKGVLLAGLAVAGSLSKTPAESVWTHAAIVLSPLMVLAYAALAASLFEGWVLSLVGLLALVFLWGEPQWLLRGVYGGHWGLAVAWAGTALAFAGGGLGWGVIAGLASAAAHTYSPFQLLAPIGLLFLCGTFVRGARTLVTPGTLAGMMLGAAPIEVARKILAGPTVNALHSQSMGWLVLPVGTVASPLQVLSWYGYPGVAVLAAAFLMAAVRRDRAGAFIVASAIAPLLLLFNPWLFRPVAEWLGSVANKVAQVWSYPLAIAWITGAFLAEGRRTVRVLAGVLLLILAIPIATTLSWRVTALIEGSPRLPPALRSAADLVARYVPREGVVASDPMTSYAIPALTGRRVIVTLHQHSPPGDRRALDRIGVAAGLFSSCVPLGDALKDARTLGARFLLTPAASSFRSDQFAAHRDPRNERILESRFSGHPDELKLLGESEGARLYALSDSTGRSGSESDFELPRTWPASYFPPAGSRNVSDGTLTLALESFPRSTRRRGEALRLPAAWRLDQPVSDYREYLGHIRFEKEDQPAAVSVMSFIYKPLRRIFLEPGAGGSFRWRAVELPFRGLCPVATWPQGVWLPDTLDIEIPRQLVPGLYRVEIGLEQGTLYPVLTSADLLSDRDRFSGPVIGHMEIK